MNLLYIYESVEAYRERPLFCPRILMRISYSGASVYQHLKNKNPMYLIGLKFTPGVLFVLKIQITILLEDSWRVVTTGRTRSNTCCSKYKCNQQ